MKENKPLGEEEGSDGKARCIDRFFEDLYNERRRCRILEEELAHKGGWIYCHYGNVRLRRFMVQEV